MNTSRHRRATPRALRDVTHTSHVQGHTTCEARRTAQCYLDRRRANTRCSGGYKPSMKSQREIDLYQSLHTYFIHYCCIAGRTIQPVLDIAPKCLIFVFLSKVIVL